MPMDNNFFNLNSEVSLSAGHDRMVVFARRGNGELAHISEVDNGKACGCFCLACEEALIARQGTVREHSFAHQSGTQCQHAMEAMLHGVIQRLIERHRRFVTPELVVSASVPGPHGPVAETRIQPPIKVPVDSVALIERPPWPHPCVEALVKGHSVLIHVAARRTTRADKRQALAMAGQAAVEIDLSGQGPRTVGDLARLLFSADDRKTWLFNPKVQAMEAEIRAAMQPVADEQWAKYHAAQERKREEQRERELALEKARAEQQRVLALRAAARERPHGPLQDGRAAPRETEASPAPEPRSSILRHAKPAELSPAVEYLAPAGSLWLLHSSDGNIYLRVEPQLTQVLAVIAECGAEFIGASGVWRMSPLGWSNASIDLSRTWTSVRTMESAQ